MGQIASQALARKWRPRDFNSLVGQEHVVQALSHALSSNRLHHAYLLTGTRGVGKTTIARILARAVNCEKGVSATPCGQCQACVEIAEGRFADLLEVDAATNTRVDEMRHLLDNAAYMPTSGRYKVYVIDEVHMLSTSSFNAMLKTLEEPPEHIIFILATTDPQKIPATVLSRCLQFGLRQLGVDQLINHLASVLKSEQVDFENGALRLLAKAARGSVRDALSLTDQAIAYGANCLTEAGVRQMLGFVDENVTLRILQALVEKKGDDLIQLSQNLAQKNVSFSHVLEEFANACFYLSVQDVAGGLSQDDPDQAALLEFSRQFSGEDLQLFYQVSIHARDELHLAPEPYIGFGMALIRMLCFKPSSIALAQPVLEKPAAHGQRPRAANAAASQNVHQVASQLSQYEADAKAPIAKPVVSTGDQLNQRQTQGAAVALAAVKEVIASRHQDKRHVPPVASVSQQVNAVNCDANGRFECLTPDDWPRLAASLPATGLIRQALVQSEFVAYDLNEGVGVLSLRTATRSLADAGLIQKIESLLTQQFDGVFQVQFEIAEVHVTAALLEQRVRKQSQDAAEQAIAEDPFVQELQQEMGATLVRGSVKPVNTDAPSDF